MMNLKKKELIFSIIIMVIFLAIGLNISVFATNDDERQNINLNFNNIQNSQNTQIPVNNSTTNIGGTIQVNNTTLIKDAEVSNTNNANTNKNNPNQLANTGLEDLPWVIIGLCAVSAIFAYKKIKEYKID